RGFITMNHATTSAGFLGVVLGLSLFGPGPARAEWPMPAPGPFDRLKGNTMPVMSKATGKGPNRGIFDTGAPVRLLTTRVAKESGVLKGVKPPLFSPFGSMGQVKIGAVELGRLKAENVPAVVMDHPTVELISKYLGPIEGIVGFPFFARY